MTNGKNKLYTAVRFRRPLSINGAEHEYLMSIIGYRKRPNTISYHDDDMIDGQGVVTSQIVELKIDLFFAIIKLEKVIQLKKYIVWHKEQ